MWHPFWKKTVQKTSSSYQSDLPSSSEGPSSPFFAHLIFRLRLPTSQNWVSYGCCCVISCLGILILCILFWRLRKWFPLLRKMIEMLQPQKRWFQPPKNSQKTNGFLQGKPCPPKHSLSSSGYSRMLDTGIPIPKNAPIFWRELSSL